MKKKTTTQKVKRPPGLGDSPWGLNGVTATILAGGRGTRLQPVIGDRPKVLADVGGRPFVTYLLDQLATAGFRDVVLLTGHKAEQVHDLLGKHYAKMKLVHSPEAEPVGTAGALRNALQWLGATVLLLNGDSWCDADLFDFHKFHRLNGALVSMVLVKTADASRYGRVLASEDGRVIQFDEKKDSGAGWINAGIYLIDRALIEQLAEGKMVSLERELIPRWLEEERKIYGYRHDGRFLDIGTPESYATTAACDLALAPQRSAASRKRQERG